MRQIMVTKETLTEGAFPLSEENGSCTLHLSKNGAGISLPQLMICKERFLTFCAEVLEEHSQPMHLLLYVQGEQDPAFELRFGLLPKVRTMICVDLNWLDARELFPEAAPGMLKIVCHGRRVCREEISKAILSSLPSFHDVKIKIEGLYLTDEHPASAELPQVKLVDRFGQNRRKTWRGKTESLEQLSKQLREQYADRNTGYPFEDWSIYGGWKKKKLRVGTGYFSRYKDGDKWWLIDPLGYAFFSMGPDCVGPGSDCRVDGVEQWLDWLPDRQDAEYGKFFREFDHHGLRRSPLTFSFPRANLYQAFGERWYEKWKDMMGGQLRKYGMNTLGNWSDTQLWESAGIPYVASLPEFPSTRQSIFRDFPDVFSQEYTEQARRCAQVLEKEKCDSLMIGYFLRNEPAWAFVDGLVLADEVLYNPAKTACKEKLIAFLRDRYQSIERLNEAWESCFNGFEDLYQQQKDTSKRSKAAKRDMREFSREMIRAYIEIPVHACRTVDPNHMILGMRWAWISNPDLVTGWENFDVFSINCYAVDPTDKIQDIVDLGVDLPILIGEFHFGALDAGLSATGLEGVENQNERGIAYQYYCERVAAHPNGVGCHYFQCYDQFVLGRFDGENYNIGLFDICSRVYPEMMEQIRECSGRIYAVADGQERRSTRKPKSIPMIAY